MSPQKEATAAAKVALEAAKAAGLSREETEKRRKTAKRSSETEKSSKHLVFFGSEKDENRLHRHRPQIASTHPNCKKNKKGTKHMRRSWRETSLGGKAAAAAKSSPEWRSWRETNEGRQGGRSSQEQARMEIMQGDKWRQGQPRAGQNGDDAERQIKGDKWRQEQPRGPEWRSCRETNLFLPDSSPVHVCFTPNTSWLKNAEKACRLLADCGWNLASIGYQP